MAVDASNYRVEYKSGSDWIAIPSGKVLDVSTAGAASAGDAPLAFASSTDTRATIELVGDAVGDLAKDTPFRVAFSRASTEAYAHVGQLSEISRNLGSVTFTSLGKAEYLRRTKAYSPAFYRRPVATRTSATSIENPADVSYQGGLINWLNWTAGGRPAAQDYLYPDAKFYYRCDQALLAPTWSWVAGDDSYQACLDLAAAGGGQFYQDETGVLVYRNPLLFAGGTQVYTFGPGVYQDDLAYTLNPAAVADVFLCQYTGRAARPLQELYNDQPGLTLKAGETQTLELEPNQPLAQLETNTGGVTLLPAALNISFYGNEVVQQANPGGYVHSISVRAGKVTLNIGNYSTRTMKIHRITLRGKPIVATENGSVRYGSGSVERSIPQNVFIQSRAQGLRLCHLQSLFNNAQRKVFSFTALFDPARVLGERVGLTVPEWGMTNVPCVIIDRQIDETGGTVKYQLVDATGIPLSTDFFNVGNQNYTGLTKKLGV